MTIRKWLIIDSNYLCYRNFYAIGPLITSTGLRSEVVFSFLRDIQSFKTLHNTHRVAFCFDGGYEKRTAIFPEYKIKKGFRTEYEEELMSSLQIQIERLREVYLPELGYKNVFRQPGYEADDIIASICLNLKENEQAIIVAADRDFNQLLSKQVIIWNPKTKEPTTVKSFKQKYGIKPKQWPKVLAIAGGHDNIAGVTGVGEVTALRYLRGELSKSAVAFSAIQNAREMIERNLKLVKLPMPGTGTFTLRNDLLSRESWDKIIRRLEMKTLVKKRKQT